MTDDVTPLVTPLVTLVVALVVASAVVVPPRTRARLVLPTAGGPVGTSRPGQDDGRGRWRRGRVGPRDGDAELVALLDLLVPALRAGLPVALALADLPVDTARGAGSGEPAPPGRPGRPGRRRGWVVDLTRDLAAQAASGRPLAEVWSVHAAASGSVEGAFVARAWSLSETLGAPLAESVAEAASAVRQRIARTQRLEVAVAGPRATARVLTLLPLAGPVVAPVLGVSLAQLYSGLGGVSAALGGLLLLLGRAWCGRLLRGVTRPLAASELR